MSPFSVVPMWLSSNCISKPTWLIEAHTQRRGRESGEAEEMQYTQHERTQAGSEEALVGFNTGAGYKETPLWLSRQTEVALG